MNVMMSTHVAHSCGENRMGQKFLQFWANFQKSKKKSKSKVQKKILVIFEDNMSIYTSSKNYFETAVCCILVAYFLLSSIFQKSSALTKRFQKKTLKKFLFYLKLLCKIFKLCDLKILFAVVNVSISVIFKNKSRTISCSWAKTLNNKILNW